MYIGETICYTKRRYEEHMGKSALPGRQLANPHKRPPMSIERGAKHALKRVISKLLAAFQQSQSYESRKVYS